MTDTQEEFAALLLQSTLVQLYVCLRALDLLGAHIPAAHLDAAIQSLRDEMGAAAVSGFETVQHVELIDRLAIEIFGERSADR